MKQHPPGKLSAVRARLKEGHYSQRRIALFEGVSASYVRDVKRRMKQEAKMTQPVGTFKYPSTRRLAKGSFQDGQYKVAVAFPPDMFTQLREQAKVEGRSFSHIARRYIEKGMEAEKAGTLFAQDKRTTP